MSYANLYCLFTLSNLHGSLSNTNRPADEGGGGERQDSPAPTALKMAADASCPSPRRPDQSRCANISDALSTAMIGREDESLFYLHSVARGWVLEEHAMTLEQVRSTTTGGTRAIRRATRRPIDHRETLRRRAGAWCARGCSFTTTREGSGSCRTATSITANFSFCR